MPTRPVESTPDEVRESPPETPRATVEAVPEQPNQERQAANVESSREGNADDVSYGDQDIDTAGTAHDDLSPTKSM